MHFLSRRLLSAALILAVTVPIGSHAQTYPSKPIRLIVPFPPGGNVDLPSEYARFIQEEIARTARIGREARITLD